MTLITGGNGFVGKRLLKKIRGFSDELDLLNPEALKKLPKKPDLVIHLAAETNTAKKDHRVNNDGVKNLIEALGKLDKKTHIIYVGTMVNVVGRPDCSQPVDENTTAYPTNEYTRTKTAGEKYLIAECQKQKFHLTILTPNTIYGQNVRPNSLLDILKPGILNNSILTRINWPGKAALVHVDDVVKVILAASKHPPLPGKPEKYLVYAENLSIADMSKIIHQKFKIKYQPIIIPKIIWLALAKMRIYIPYFEPMLPTFIYNQLWRVGIIVDDVVWAESSKIRKLLPKWKPILLEAGIY